jgi:hypothetical protein
MKIAFTTTIVLLLVIMGASVTAQSIFIKPVNNQIDTTFKESLNFGLNGFMYLDRVILASMPTLKHYRKIKAVLKDLPKDHVRFIDSIDYYISPSDTVNLKVYSQNYAYQSSNSYSLWNNKESLDGLLVLNKNINVNLQMKTVIEDVESYRNAHFDIDVTERKLNINKLTYRYILSKKYP